MTSTNVFDKKQCTCLAIVMNIAYLQHQNFYPYTPDEEFQKNDFSSCFGRHRSFSVGGYGSVFNMTPTLTKIFFTALWNVFRRLYWDDIDDIGSLYDTTEEGSTCQHHLPDSQLIVTNEEIKSFAEEVMTNGFFVAQAIGFKNSWPYLPRQYINACDNVQLDNFCKIATRLICCKLMNLLVADYDDRINLDLFHKNSPIVVSADIALMLTPLQENTSFIVNGIYANKVLKQLGMRSYRKEASVHRTSGVDQPTGKLHSSIYQQRSLFCL
jgi:hypothetical protein